MVSATLVLTACGSISRNEPVQLSEQSKPGNTELLSILSQLEEMKNEIKFLRNSIEELQFETENAKRRQQDLYQDLDRRLVAIERGQRVIGIESEAELLSQNNNEFANSAGDTATENNAAAQNADQVVVVGADPDQNSSSPTNTDSNAVVSSATVSLDEQNAYDAAFELLKQSRYEDSIRSFQNLVDTWPKGQLADDGYYWMSEARYVNREFERALSGFRTVVSRYPDSQRVPEALLKIGYIQYDIGTY